MKKKADPRKVTAKPAPKGAGAKAGRGGTNSKSAAPDGTLPPTHYPRPPSDKGRKTVTYHFPSGDSIAVGSATLPGAVQDEIHAIVEGKMVAEIVRLKPGEKFTERNGRGEGKIKKAIRKLLEKNPALKNPELWNQLSVLRPGRWMFLDNPAGKYAEGPAPGENMNYRRFQTAVSEVKRSLKR